jgi:hypothetical protein
LTPGNKKPRRDFGALVFDFASTAANATTSVMVKNNRERPLIITELNFAQFGAANSSDQWTIQVTDQATARQWFSSAAPLPALFGASLVCGILAADQGLAPTKAWKLPAPYILGPGAQLLISATNNSTNALALSIVAAGFYSEE